MNELDNFKSKITFENKTIIGIVGLVLGFLCWGLGQPGIGIGDVLILIFPCILLIIPNETIKNSKALGIISMIIIGFLFIFGIFHFMMVLTEYVPDSYMFTTGYVESMVMSDVLQIILAIYGLFAAFLLTIPTKPATGPSTVNMPINNNNEIKYDKYCSECGQGLFKDAKFCSKCGADLTLNQTPIPDEPAPEEPEEKICEECGHELDEEDVFCPNCGKRIE